VIRVLIRPFGLSTTQFGFGCASLLGLLSARESRRLIDAAYDAGIRHFDVARSYSYGAAEALLGSALGSRRGNVTITSKFGLAAPDHQKLVGYARYLLRPFAKRLPRLRSRSRSALTAITGPVNLTYDDAKRSLETSLRELKTDYLDVLLLHEASAEALSDTRLLQFLGEAVSAGKIRGYGVGSSIDKLAALLEKKPMYCPIVQHESCIFSREIEIPAASFRIVHGPLKHLPQLLRACEEDVVLARSLSDAIGLDISRVENVSALMLRSALINYPGSIVLFSARSSQRILENVRALSDARLDPYCSRFIEVARSVQAHWAHGIASSTPMASAMRRAAN
jgi:D-threo-aldose 1-dehydrogenase